MTTSDREAGFNKIRRTLPDLDDRTLDLIRAGQTIQELAFEHGLFVIAAGTGRLTMDAIDGNVSPLERAVEWVRSQPADSPLRQHVERALAATPTKEAGPSFGAKEISAPTWNMVTDSAGEVGDCIHLQDFASKGRSGRVIMATDAAPTRWAPEKGFDRDPMNWLDRRRSRLVSGSPGHAVLELTALLPELVAKQIDDMERLVEQSSRHARN